MPELDMPEAPAAPEPRYCYSTDEETYYGDFATRAGALAEAHGELEEDLATTEEPRTVWTAVRRPPDLPALIVGLSLAEIVIDGLSEAAGDEYGEWAAGWPDLTGAQQDALDAVLRAAVLRWFEATEGLRPEFFSIDTATVKAHEVR